MINKKWFQWFSLLPVVVTIVFIVLDCCNVIDWYWWVLLSPIILPIALLLVLCILTIVVFLILAGMYKHRIKRNRMYNK